MGGSEWADNRIAISSIKKSELYAELISFDYADYTIEKTFEEEVFPITPIDDSSKKIEFVSQASPYFTDLSEMTLQVIYFE